MIDFQTLQLNPLTSYTTKTSISITNPINLSPKEIQIFNLFKEIIKEKNLENIELRVVGGWVRDHLLNVPCNDLDITIKGIDSNTFAKFLNEKANKGKYTLVNNTLKKSNDTEIKLTKTKIFDIMIDFVDMKGNALEDAKRRDFTFNALFYNILENKIEDLLELGINDLKNGFIRPCLYINEDKIYDSLRILRMVRFASKYQFIIDDKYLSDIKHNKAIFKYDLLKKVPKEIIHKEMYSIFSGPNPSFAIYTLYKLDLLKNALHLDDEYRNNIGHLFSKKDILICVNIFIVGKKVFDKYQSCFEGDKYDNNYKSSFYPILLTIYLSNFIDINNNNLAKIILAKVLKLESKIPLKIINHFDEFNNFIAKNEYNKLNVGILLRQILIKNISAMTFISVANEYVMKNNFNDALVKLDDELLEKIFQKYYNFYKFMKKENMRNACDIKPIIDGKRIKKIFPGMPDKYIGQLIKALINKQIETNNFSEEDAEEVLKSKIVELNIGF